MRRTQDPGPRGARGAPVAGPVAATRKWKAKEERSSRSTKRKSLKKKKKKKKRNTERASTRLDSSIIDLSTGLGLSSQ